MRGWKQHGKEERSTRGYLVCDAVNALSSISDEINTHNRVIYLYWFTYFFLSLSGAEQVGAGAASQAILWTTTAGAQEETPGPEAQTGEEARCGGREAQAETEGGESELWCWKSKTFIFSEAHAFPGSSVVSNKHWTCFPELKERYESAVRRTVEKSQKAQQSLNQNSRGRKLNKNGK